MHPCCRFALLCLMSAALYSPSALAACSRPIIVPVAPIGTTVIINDTKIGGMVPDMLRLIGAKAGCTFSFSAVPRMRLEAMFEAGRADLLVAATELTRRNRSGLFIPIAETRPTLISLRSERAPIDSVTDLINRRELRVALVRGYDYGPAYQHLIEQLTSQGRLYMEPNARAVARLIHGGIADITIMPAGLLIGAVQGDPLVKGIVSRLRLEQANELTWIRTGIYISRKTLSPADQAVLEQALSASISSGEWWEAFEHHYPNGIMAGNIRALQAYNSGNTDQ